MPRRQAFRATRPGTGWPGSSKNGSSAARPATRPGSGARSGTASGAFSSTWRARRTRCISACSCPSTAATRPARPAPARALMPKGLSWSRAQLESLPGLCLHDLMLLPIDRLRRFFAGMQLPQGDAARGGDAQALRLLHQEITTRLQYLCDVGIGYLTLDRQSRTLSGGEVQRINLTTALGTSLVNTLFVLDEPSIGLHPRDMHRITEAMLRLRDA